MCGVVEGFLYNLSLLMQNALPQYRKALKVQTAKVLPCFYECRGETVIRFGTGL